MQILIAEDDSDTALMIAGVLAQEGYQVSLAETGNDALRLLIENAFDVAILDRMLPGIDGMNVLRGAREAGVKTHVLMVTALGSIANRVEGLEGGADDYLTKPFAIAELKARVQALGRRRHETETSIAACGPLSLSVVRREARYNGKLIALQPREFRLLEELVRGGGQTLTRAMLLQNVWGFSFEPQTNLVETHMSRLRTKLALAGANDIIRTVRGSGYSLRVET